MTEDKKVIEVKERVPESLAKPNSARLAAENIARMLALFDDIEAVYDVDMETGEYSLVVKGRTGFEEVYPHLIKKDSFFEDVALNIGIVFPDDREDVLRVTDKYYIREVLARNNHFDWYYRNFIDGDQIWRRMRFVYRDESREHLIVGIFNAEEEVAAKNEAEQERNELIAQMSGGLSLYIVDPVTERFRVLNQNSYLADNYKDEEDFQTSFSRYITADVFEPDREMVAKTINVEQMVQHLARAKEYVVQYRDISSGVPRWYEMRAVKLSTFEILFSFTDKDKEIILGHLDEQERLQDLALLAVDLDNGTLKFIKTNPYDPQYSVGEVKPYCEVIAQIGSRYEGEVGDFFAKIGDTEKLRNILAMNYKHTFTYRSRFASDQWINITGYVVARHEDGVPATAVLCFALVDTLGSDKAAYLERFKENMEIIGGLATEYTALYYVDLDTGDFKPYYLNKRVEDIVPHIERSPKFVDLARAFATSPLVHPEDSRNVLAMYPSDEAVREALRGKKKLTLVFRRNYEGEYLWTNLEIVKCEEINEEPHKVIVGFMECDNETRTEQTLQASLNILGSDADPDKNIRELLCLVGEYYGADRSYIFEFNTNKETIRNSYEWCATGVEPMQEHLQSVPVEQMAGWVNEFRRQGFFFMDSLDSEHNSEETIRTLQMQGIQSLVAAPIMNGTEIFGFIGVDNPARAEKEVGVLRKLAAMVYSEILQRNELAGRNAFTGYFLEPFVSAYYIGLDDLSCQVYKRNARLNKLYPDVSSYLANFTEYINNDVHPEDRESVLETLRPENIKRRLADVRQYSHIFRDISDGAEKIIRCQIIRGQDENHAALGFIDITGEVEMQRANQER